MKRSQKIALSAASEGCQGHCQAARELREEARRLTAEMDRLRVAHLDEIARMRAEAAEAARRPAPEPTDTTGGHEAPEAAEEDIGTMPVWRVRRLYALLKEKHENLCVKVGYLKKEVDRAREERDMVRDDVLNERYFRRGIVP